MTILYLESYIYEPSEDTGGSLCVSEASLL